MAAVRRAHGDAEGTRALIEVLMLHRTMAHEHVVAGIAAALQVGALTADVVAVEARKAAQAEPSPDPHSASAPARRPDARPAGRPVDTPEEIISLTQPRLAFLPVDTRPPPSVAAYDQLLRNRPARQGDAS